MHSLAEIIEGIRQQHAARGFLFVGLSGLGNTGKTHVSRQLAAALEEVIVIHIDDFYKPEEKRGQSHASTSQTFISNCFDWDVLEEKVFDALESGAQMLRYDVQKDLYLNKTSRCMAVPRRGIIILEGLYALQQRFVERYDATIWVHATEAERDARAKERYTPDFYHLWETVWKGQDQRYLDVHQPHTKADFVFHNIEMNKTAL